jgi:hypothetical protein
LKYTVVLRIGQPAKIVVAEHVDDNIVRKKIIAWQVRGL